MTDAAGTMYLIGGHGATDGTYFNDVWMSTDQGADRTQGALNGDIVICRSRID